MKHLLHTIPATCLFLVALLGAAATRAAENPAEPDELAIYKALFSGREIVVLIKLDPDDEQTRPASPDARTVARYKENLPGVEDATIADYHRRGSASPSLTPESNVGVKLLFLDPKDMEEIFYKGEDSERGWTRFRERFHTKGLTTISRVGFNQSRTQALVFMDDAWASLGAEGYTILLEKRDGKWTIKARIMETAS